MSVTMVKCRHCGEDVHKVYDNGWCRLCQLGLARDAAYGKGAGAWAREREREQDGCCLLCGKKPDGTPYQTLQLDHDHDSGEWRGMVCRSCNHLVAFVERHGIELIFSILRYLKVM